MKVLTDEVKTRLAEKLNPEYISQRPGGGNKQLSFIEGHHAIREANRIFDYQWSKEIIGGPAGLVDLGVNQKGKRHFMCLLRVTAGGEVREDVGYGSGNNADDVELATKEAVTDALKRCLKDWGDPFGLALYDGDGDKGQHVEPPKPDPPKLHQGKGFKAQLEEQKARIGYHMYASCCSAAGLPFGEGAGAGQLAAADKVKQEALQNMMDTPTLTADFVRDIVANYEMTDDFKGLLDDLKANQATLIQSDEAIYKFHMNTERT